MEEVIRVLRVEIINKRVQISGLLRYSALDYQTRLTKVNEEITQLEKAIRILRGV